jgi:hypothetical protein
MVRLTNKEFRKLSNRNTKVFQSLTRLRYKIDALHLELDNAMWGNELVFDMLFNLKLEQSNKAVPEVNIDKEIKDPDL